MSFLMVTELLCQFGLVADKKAENKLIIDF